MILSDFTNLFLLPSKQNFPSNTLYIVGTPIGNLADITIRAIYLISVCDYIVAEDTRVASVLLNSYGIRKPLLSAYKYNERKTASRIIEYLNKGKRVAYIVDAGTPNISDPGAILVETIKMAGFSTVPIPGVSALTTAISIAESWAIPFTFIGFLPKKKKLKLEILNMLAMRSEALILYESPHRLYRTIGTLIPLFGPNRKIFLGHELTKLHETLFNGTLAILYENLKTTVIRGEYILIIQGCSTNSLQLSEKKCDKLLSILLKELSFSKSIYLLSCLTDISRSVLYQRALKFVNK